MSSSLEIGRKGEEIARKFLLTKGFNIIEKNYHTRWGEVDIIAKKRDLIAFVEVKTRRNIRQGLPHEAVTKLKREHMMRSATAYVLQKGLNKYKLSLQVVSIILTAQGNLVSLKWFEDICY